MAEDTAQTDDDAAPVGGERLRIARRENDISVRDVAKELHLDEPKVRALEKNEFDVLGAPVFAKGHLRKYAELVGVPVDDIMSDYYQMNRAVGAPPVVGPKKKTDRDMSVGPWVGLVGIAALLAGAAYWWMNRMEAPQPVPSVEPATLAPFNDSGDDASASASTASAPELPDTDVPPSEDADAAETTIETVAGQATESGAAEPQAPPLDSPSVTYDVPVQAQEAQQPSNLPQVDVELSFSGECWTEVSDASGRRLYYDLGTPGAVVQLSGDAPLRVVLGNSENVSIRVGGRDYTIPQSSRSGRLARLTLDNP